MDDIETFNIRGGTVDYGKEYEILVAAYYALHLSIDDTVIDFKLSTNNKDMGDFDDVVLELEFENNDKRLLALQLKHHANDNKNLALESLASEKGDFSLLKYCQQYKIIKNTCEKKYDLDFNKFHFVLFTNKPVTDFVKHVEGKKVEVSELDIKNSDITIYIHDVCAGNNLINTFEERTKSIYKFRDSSDKLEPEFLKQFSLYTKQKHAKTVQNDIICDIQRIFKVTDKNIALNYIRFFKDWCQGLFGQKDRSFKLTKSDVRLKIAELILTPNMIELNPIKSNDKSGLLLETMKKFDVTIINNTPDVSDAVKTTFDVLSTVDLAQTLEKDPKLYDYLRKFGLISGRKQKFEELSQKQLLVILWYLNLAPLILEVGEKLPYLLPALQLSRYGKAAPAKNFILLGDISREDFEPEWKIFNNLSDLPDTSSEVLKTFTFLLQDRHEVTIEQLVSINSGCLKIISTEKLLQTSITPLLIGQEKEILPEYYMTRTIPKIIFDVQLIDETEDLLIVSCNGKLSNFKELIKTNAIQIDEYLLVSKNYTPKKFSISYYREFIKGSSNFDHQKIVLVTDQECSVEDFHRIVNKNPGKNCHHFRFIDQNNLEWVQSTNIKNLKKHQKQQFVNLVQDEEIFDYFRQDINVLCADPGMGKSVMVNFLANVCPSDFWTIKIDLNHHYQFFKKSNTANLLDYLLGNESAFSKSIFKLFLLKKRIVILWDSFDEMPQEIVKIVLDTITTFKKMGFRQWITGRYYCRDVLEETLQVFALTLTQLSDEEQKIYAHRRLRDGLPADLFEKIIGKVYENLSILSKCDYLNFAGVPLQVHMLVEIFLQDPDKYIDDDVQIVTITDIYKNFLEGKFQTFYKKMNPDLNKYLTLQIQESYKKDRLIQYRTAALKSHLDENDFNSLNLNCQELLQDIVDGKDNLGIIIRVDDDGSPIFAHRTYSEFLVASWFTVDIKKTRELTKIFFRGDFINIRLMFDLILAKRTKPHLALLYQDFDFFKQCPKELIRLKDECGRNLLHLACSWGPRCPIVTTVKDTILQVSYEESHEFNESYSTTVTILLEVIDPTELDDLFQWDAITYSDQAQCLLPIELIGKFDHLKNYQDVATICHYSIIYGYEKIFGALSKTIPMLKYSDGSTLLHACARHDRVQHLSIILKKVNHRIVINNQNSSHETPLDIASRCGHLEIIKLLLDKGASVNGKYFVPLFEATRGNQLDCCVELIKRGASQLNGALVNATYGKSLDIIDILIEAGANINHQNAHNGCTPLHTATTRNNSEMVKKLLQQGGDPKIRNKDNWTCLDLAFGLKHEDNVYEIIKSDKHIIEICNSYDVPPLINAITLGFDKVVDLLIKQGADVNRFHFPSSPLHASVDEDNYSYVLSLLEAGAFPNLESLDNFIPLSHVQSLEVMKLLIQYGADVNMVTTTGMTPLHFASYFGRLEIVKGLIKLGVRINCVDKKIKTPLCYALKKSHPHVVTFLLENGAQILNGRDSLFQTALNKSESCFSLLLQRGVDINEKDTHGRTILHFVILMNNVEIVKKLLDSGADLNLCDKDGYTPLCLATVAGSSSVVRELIQRGADVNSENSSKESPLHIAAFLGDLVSVSLLLQAGAQPNRSFGGMTPLYRLGLKKDYKILTDMFQNESFEKVDYHINDNHEECIKLLVDHGADVNLSMVNSLTPLHLYAHNQQINLMKTLIESGAHVNCQDKYKQTPLHFCAINGSIDGALLLIDNGARVNICDSFGKTPLCWAVENHHQDLIKLLVNSGADVNYFDKNSSINTTPLIVACTNSDLATVDWLIERGADVNQNGDVQKVVPVCMDDFHFSEDLIDWKKYTSDGNFVNLVNDNLKLLDNISPLNLAIVNCDEAIINSLMKNGGNVNKFEQNGWNSFLFSFSAKSIYGLPQKLIEAGASVNGFIENGMTPLSMALLTKNEVFFQYLIIVGADVNQQLSSGASVLHVTCTDDNYYNFTEILVKSGSNINMVDTNMATPLHWSVLHNNFTAIKYLLDNGAVVNTSTINGSTPLYTAAVKDNFEIVKLLYEKDADVNLADKDGLAPIHIVASSGNEEIFDFLLDKEETCINYKNSNGFTPLAIATFKNHLHLVKKVCQKGAIIDISDEKGKTPLLLAVATGSYSTVEFLCEKGANVNCQMTDGTTPLHVACGENRKTIVECLLKHGANPNVKDENGLSPLLSCLLDANDLSLVKFLHEEGANINEDFVGGNTLLHPAATLTKPENLKYLIENGLSVHVINKNGDTCLHNACLYGNYENAKFLIKMGVDINAVNNSGESCLRNAIASKNLELVKFLVENGANVDHPNHHGNTPLFFGSALGQLEIVKFLKSRGAKIDVVDNDGDLPLHDAARYGHLEVVKFLVENGSDLSHLNKKEESAFDLAFSNGKIDVCQYLVNKM